MAKAPRPGEVKTRLFPVLAQKDAARLYEAFLGDVVQESCAPGAWTCTLAHHPPGDPGPFLAFSPPVGLLWPQSGQGLAERLADVVDRALRQVAAVVVRGSDSPTVSREDIRRAFELLESGEADVVLAPDGSGGYCLVGLTRPQPRLFDVPVSTRSNLDETMARAREEGLAVARLEERVDVDEPRDLARLVRELAADEALRERCPRTVSVLESVGWSPFRR